MRTLLLLPLLLVAITSVSQPDLDRNYCGFAPNDSIDITNDGIADLVVQEQRGTAYGLYHAVVGLMAFPASVLAGILWQGIGGWPGLGASAPFYFGAVMALLAGILLVWLRPGKTDS